jgi:hypothetical protein
MKLFLCKSCQDVVRLLHVNEQRWCSCGKASGKLLDSTRAEFYGKVTVPIGIDNRTLLQALSVGTDHLVPYNFLDFKAFVFRSDAPNVKLLAKDPSRK